MEYRDFYIHEKDYRSDGLIQLFAVKKGNIDSGKTIFFVINNIDLLESTFHNNVDSYYESNKNHFSSENGLRI
jgi:hypothetical protein